MSAPYRGVENTDDVIDSRDVIKRIEELEEERSDIEASITDHENTLEEEAFDDEAGREAIEEERNSAQASLESWDEDNGAELAALKSLVSDAEGYGDWAHGATLVRDSYFKEYAQQYADDSGAIDASASWPMSCIDWDQAARELQMDFTSVDFDGITYWMQS